VEKLSFLLSESRKAASKAENSRLYRIIRVLNKVPPSATFWIPNTDSFMQIPHGIPSLNRTTLLSSQAKP